MKIKVLLFAALVMVLGATSIKAQMNVGSTAVPKRMLDVQGSIYAKDSIGIGTTAPAEKLEVDGNIFLPLGNMLTWVATSSNTFAYDGATLPQYGILVKAATSSATPVMNISDYQAIRFFTNGTPRMRMNTGGFLSIGDNSGTDAASARVDIQGDASNNASKALLVRNLAGTSLFNVRNDGAVGINTNYAGAPLDVTDNVNLTYQNYTSAETVLRLQRQGASGQSYNQAVDLQIGKYQPGVPNTPSRTFLTFKLAGEINGSTPNVEIMTLKADSTVGIGTNGSTATLDVNNRNSTAIPVLKLTTPFPGATTDSLLTWNSADKSVRKLTAAAFTNGSAWGLTGNAGTVAGTNFIGTTDDNDVVFKRNGVQAGLINSALRNVSLGINALNPSTTGNSNTAMGDSALFSNTTGFWNQAIGYNSLYNNTTGAVNVAMGNQILFSNTSGFNNIGVGNKSLYFNTSGYSNIAAGIQTMYNNTIGTYNVALGYNALLNNISGSFNIGIGTSSLVYNTTGRSNKGIGFKSVYFNTTGNYNIGLGDSTLLLTSTGSYNTALGHQAGLTNTTGSNNIALGYRADFGSNNLTNAIAIGTGAVATQSNSMILGGTVNPVSVGINTTAPNTSLQVNGSFGAAISAGTSIVDGDGIYTLKCTGNVTLPTPATTNNGRIIYLVYASGSVVITGTLSLGGSTISTFGLNSSANSRGIQIQSDGSNWVIISTF